MPSLKYETNPNDSFSRSASTTLMEDATALMEDPVALMGGGQTSDNLVGMMMVATEIPMLNNNIDKPQGLR